MNSIPTIVEHVAAEALLPTDDIDYGYIDHEHSVTDDELVKLSTHIDIIRAALARYQTHLARRLEDSGWRPTGDGDDVVIVTRPKPSAKVNDEATFWSFVGDILIRHLTDPEMSEEEAIETTARIIGKLFNPNAIRMGAFKQMVKQILDLDPSVVVDSLYTKPETDMSKPPRIARVPKSKWKYDYREQT